MAKDFEYPIVRAWARILNGLPVVLINNPIGTRLFDEKELAQFVPLIEKAEYTVLRDRFDRLQEQYDALAFEAKTWKGNAESLARKLDDMVAAKQAQEFDYGKVTIDGKEKIVIVDTSMVKSPGSLPPITDGADERSQ